MRKIPWTWSDGVPWFRHGDAAGRAGDGLLDFSISVNPLGPPLSVLHALRRQCAPAGPGVIARYPDPESGPLRQRLAQHHGVAPAQVVVGNGANDVIYAAARAFRPSRAAIVEPAYTEYLRASLGTGALIDHWLPQSDTIQPRPFDPHGADLVWLANPNNPTGRLWAPGELVPWIAAHPQTLFIVDEAFLPFRPDEAAHTLIPAVNRLANLVVVRSLTKLYALPGLRLGYAVAAEARASQLRAAIVPWSVNALAQGAGLVALEDRPFLAQTHAWFTDQGSSFAGQLRACSDRLEPLPSEANFVLVRLHGITAGQLTARLLERGMAIRDASNFIGLDEPYVRLAVRTAEDNQRLLAALRTLLNEE